MRIIDADYILDDFCCQCNQEACEGGMHGSIQECATIRALRDVIDVESVDINEIYDQAIYDVIKEINNEVNNARNSDDESGYMYGVYDAFEYCIKIAERLKKGGEK